MGRLGMRLGLVLVLVACSHVVGSPVRSGDGAPQIENKQTALNAAHHGTQAKHLPKQAHVAAKVEKAVPKHQSTMLDMVVVIPTVRRFTSSGATPAERYLEPLVKKLAADLETSDKVKFFILNSDKEPEKHREAIDLISVPNTIVFDKYKSRSNLVEDAAKTGVLEDGRVFNQEWVAWVASENLDAAFLFEKAKDLAPYILFLEDDVYPTTRALQKLSDHVHSMEVKNVTDWLFLDLYTPNLSWNPNMLNVKNEERYAFQCCTQAMLFKSEDAPALIEFWRRHANEPIDDNLRHFLESERKDKFVYAVRPNLFEHVGSYSSNPQKSTGRVEHVSLEFKP
eukprot:c52164_g1_i1.p1 GENE.c52164_g1_i1~~c52164_g1_i1.p1  ORF type:complete len:339 (+),score=70.16 c52164_g1_i1:1-1017(+)